MHLYHDRTNQLCQDGTIQSQHNGTIQPGTGTSKPHVLQLSAPVPVSILPQPCIPNYLEHDVPGISPMPSHNITIQTQINYLGSAKQLFKSPKYPLKISQAKPRSNWSNRGRNGVKTPKIAQKQHLPAHQAPAAALRFDLVRIRISKNTISQTL